MRQEVYLRWSKSRNVALESPGEIDMREDPKTAYRFDLVQALERAGLTAAILGAPVRDVQPIEETLKRIGCWRVAQQVPLGRRQFDCGDDENADQLTRCHSCADVSYVVVVR